MMMAPSDSESGSTRKWRWFKKGEREEVKLKARTSSVEKGSRIISPRALDPRTLGPRTLDPRHPKSQGPVILGPMVLRTISPGILGPWKPWPLGPKVL